MFAVLLVIVWPIAELLVAIQVAQTIGILLTVVLLIAGWPIGVALLRAEGRSAWRRLSAAVAAGRPPGREVLDGALVVAGGALLIVPGFITDLLGIALLLPPGRAAARVAVVRNFRSRLVVRAAGWGGRGGPPDVDSAATDADAPQLRR